MLLSRWVGDRVQRSKSTWSRSLKRREHGQDSRRDIVTESMNGGPEEDGGNSFSTRNPATRPHSRPTIKTSRDISLIGTRDGGLFQLRRTTPFVYEERRQFRDPRRRAANNRRHFAKTRDESEDRPCPNSLRSRFRKRVSRTSKIGRSATSGEGLLIWHNGKTSAKRGEKKI